MKNTSQIFIALAALLSAACAQADDHKLDFKQIGAAEARRILPGVDIPDKIDPRNPDMVDMSKPPSEVFIPEYSIAKYDLNKDGKEEVFLYRAGSGMCGSAGCQLNIYHLRSGAYENILGEPNSPIWSGLYVVISKNMTNGFHNVMFPERWSRDFVTWQWNGKYYSITKIHQAK